ncbi:choice-of-anchor A family protein [Nocardioides sp. CN2-186]|uniref:choice-of-anchor A family protein n=1 Tax=Nocardioides tweenelious TaxID=3156607 RepID=UPI0032B32F44
MRTSNTFRFSVLAGVLAAAGLVAVVAPVDGRADATPTCTSGVLASNAFGAATGWTEFVQGNGTRGAESEGTIAYGGNHSASSMTVNPMGTTASGDPALVVVGSHGSYNLQHGSAYLNPQNNVNFNGGGHYLASNPIDFGTAFTQLSALSTAWGAAPSTGTVTTGVTGGNAALILTGSSSSLNVFNLTSGQASDLASGKHLGLDVPAGSTIIINVPGATPTIGGQAWLGSGSSWNQAADGNIKGAYAGLVWNFPSATSVTVSYGSAFPGTILAPGASVNIASAGHTIGQIIAQNFTSNFETHLNNFPSQACVPTPPSTPGTSDVTITKSASTATPHGGDTFTYTLTAKNVGNADATGVVITDTLPAGVTYVSSTSPCTFAAGVVSCSVGTLAPNATSSVTVTVTANPIAGAGSVVDPGGDHWMTPYHPESYVTLQAHQQSSVTLACNPGDILSDGNFEVIHVDQGTGSAADVKVLSSQSTDVQTWKGVIRNDTTGQAQAKAFIVCLPGRTEGGANGHRHNLLADTAAVSTTVSLPAGRSDVTLTCRPGTVPIVPGYDLSSASAVLAGSEGDYTARTWTLTFDAASPVTVTASVRCLSTTTSAVDGHTHQLRFTHVVTTVSVPGNTFLEGNMFRVTCPDDAKGVVGTFELPPGVLSWGNEPQIKERDFRLSNQTGTAKNATIDLFCLGDRVGTGMGTTDPVSVVNTATVSSTSTDANSGNNSATATVAVQPGSVTASPASVHLSASALRMRVASSMPGKGAVTVRSGGTVLAKGTMALKAGRTSSASLQLTAAGKRKVGGLHEVSVTVDPSRGRATTKTVALQH